MEKGTNNASLCCVRPRSDDDRGLHHSVLFYLLSHRHSAFLSGKISRSIYQQLFSCCLQNVSDVQRWISIPCSSAFALVCFSLLIRTRLGYSDQFFSSVDLLECYHGLVFVPFLCFFSSVISVGGGECGHWWNTERCVHAGSLDQMIFNESLMFARW